jgi:hypothetical protein
MTGWSIDELLKIVDTDGLKVSPLRTDGIIHGTPTWIWCVTVNGELFVRGYHGQASRWYQAAVTQKAGRIIAAGMIKDVMFEPVSNGALNDAIDTAYRAKYATSPYLKPMIGASARSATVRVSPGAA